MILFKSRLWSDNSLEVWCGVMMNGGGGDPVWLCVGTWATISQNCSSSHDLQEEQGSLVDRSWVHCRPLTLLTQLMQVHRFKSEQYEYNAGQFKGAALGDEAIRRTIVNSIASHIKKVLLVTLSVYFDLSIFQPIKLKRNKLSMFEDRRNKCGVSMRLSNDTLLGW